MGDCKDISWVRWAVDPCGKMCEVRNGVGVRNGVVSMEHAGWVWWVCGCICSCGRQLVSWVYLCSWDRCLVQHACGCMCGSASGCWDQCTGTCFMVGLSSQAWGLWPHQDSSQGSSISDSSGEGVALESSSFKGHRTSGSRQVWQLGLCDDSGGALW